MKTRLIIALVIFSSTCVYAQKYELCNNPKFNKHLVEIRSLYYKKHIKQASAMVDSLLQTAKSSKDQSCLNYYSLIYEKGNLNIENDKLGEALITFHDLIDNLVKTNFKDLEAHAYLSIALLHELNGRPESCFENLKIANSIITKYKLIEPRSRYYVRTASYYRVMVGNKDSCLVNSQKAVKNISFAQNFKDIGDAYFLLYACTPKDQRIEDQRISSLSYIEKAGDLVGASFLSFSIYNDLYAKGKITEANIFLEKIKLDYLDKLDENTREKYACLAMYHERKKIQASEFNDTKTILYHTELQFKNELLAKEKEKQSALNRLEEQYLFEKEQKKNKALEEKSKILYTILYSALLVLGLLIGFLYFVHRSRERIKKQKEIIEDSINKIKELNHKNEILLSEVHHRIKNSLQNVVSILTIKKARTKDIESQELLSEISNRVNCISLIHEQLYQNEEFEMINVQDYIYKICTLHHQISNSQIHIFTYEVDVNKTHILNIDTMMPMGIILNELITNSIKHAQTEYDKLQLKITVKDIGELHYKLCYSDNGKNYINKINTKDGMGQLVINSMIKQINGSSMQSFDNGYRIEIDFKEKTTSKV